MDHVMEGADAPEDAILIPPDRVVIRDSTDIVAIEDMTIAAADRFLSR